MVSKPLLVAGVAMGLLVVSVGFEVLFHRTYALEVDNGDGWLALGTTGSDPYDVARPLETTGGSAVEAARGDTLTFRLRVDNGYPWAVSEAYDVRVAGVIVAEGTIEAAARSEGVSTFDLRADLFFSQGAPGPSQDDRNITFAYLDVQVDDRHLSGGFQLREVA